MQSVHPAIEKWAKEVAALTTPDQIVYCDGSAEEGERITRECLATGELIELNQKKLPGCYLHRSASHDVARTEHLTFISTEHEEDSGPNNNWMSPPDARAKLTPLFKGAMKGRTMYVVPFLMGPPGSHFSKVGVEITDSRYVVLNMRIMTRVGKIALDHLDASGDFTKCLHSLGDLSPDRRYIVHFPEENTVWSFDQVPLETVLMTIKEKTSFSLECPEESLRKAKVTPAPNDLGQSVEALERLLDHIRSR